MHINHKIRAPKGSPKTPRLLEPRPSTKLNAIIVFPAKVLFEIRREYFDLEILSKLATKASS
jgi:hypothetical protein